VMSSDIEDGCLASLWTFLGAGGGVLLFLVVGAGVECEFFDEFSVGGDNADFGFVDKHADGGACEAAANSEVVQYSCVPQAELDPVIRVRIKQHLLGGDRVGQ
jgi:hypothetical protein